MKNYRVNIVEVLQLIAFKSEQIDLYDEAKGALDIPDYLLNKWEVVYRPDANGFMEEFAESELRQLNSFTDFFLARMSSFPESFNDLLKDPYWNAVCEFACEILKDFEQGDESKQRNNY